MSFTSLRSYTFFHGTTVHAVRTTEGKPLKQLQRSCQRRHVFVEKTGSLGDVQRKKLWKTLKNWSFEAAWEVRKWSCLTGHLMKNLMERMFAPKSGRAGKPWGLEDECRWCNSSWSPYYDYYWYHSSHSKRVAGSPKPMDQLATDHSSLSSMSFNPPKALMRRAGSNTNILRRAIGEPIQLTFVCLCG